MPLGKELLGTAGATAGGVGGAALGTAVAGPLGGVIGGQVGSKLGGAVGNAVGGLFGGGNSNSPVPLTDPNQSARLREIDRTRNQISSGKDPITQQAISDIKATGETTKAQLAKASGGNVGGTISSLLRAQRNTGKGINDRFTQSQGRIPFFENLSTQMGNRISQRKLELNIHDADQKSAENAQAKTNANLNTSGLISSLGGAQGIAGLVKDSGVVSNIFGGGKSPVIGESGGVLGNGVAPGQFGGATTDGTALGGGSLGSGFGG